MNNKQKASVVVATGVAAMAAGVLVSGNQISQPVMATEHVIEFAERPDSITTFKTEDGTVIATIEERTRGKNKGRVRIEFVPYDGRLVPVRETLTGHDAMARDLRPRSRRQDVVKGKKSR